MSPKVEYAGLLLLSVILVPTASIIVWYIKHHTLPAKERELDK